MPLSVCLLSLPDGRICITYTDAPVITPDKVEILRHICLPADKQHARKPPAFVQRVFFRMNDLLTP